MPSNVSAGSTLWYWSVDVCGLELVKLNYYWKPRKDKTQLRYQLCLQSTAMCLYPCFLNIIDDSDCVYSDPENAVIK